MALRKLRHGERVVTKVSQALISFHRRIFHPIDFSKIVIFEDDVTKYIQYFIAMNHAVETLSLNNGVTYQFCPFHLDLWIIPRKVVNAAASATDEEDDDEKKADVFVDNIGNIENRLKERKWTYKRLKHPVRQKNDPVGVPGLRLKDVFLEGFKTMLGDSNPENGIKRNQRVIVFVDRRNTDSDHPDLIYVAQHDEERFREISTDFLPETFHWSTKKGLFPGKPNESHTGWKFVVSWHVESTDVMRVYWQFGHWLTRFFPMDTLYLWPRWFTAMNSVQESEIKPLRQALRRMKVSHEGRFERWFEQTTESELHVKPIQSQWNEKRKRYKRLYIDDDNDGELGRGVFGIVFKAEDTKKEHKVVAVKTVHAIRDGLTTKIRAERNLMKQLKHQNIVQFIDYYEYTKAPKKGPKKRMLCIVMEHCEGGSIQDFMNEHRPDTDEGDVEKLAQRFAGQIKSALLYMHKKGIVHRDLKPDNVMLKKPYNSVEEVMMDHDDGILKIIDFGESKFKRMMGGLTAMITHDRGARAYRAPEVFKGDGDNSPYRSNGTQCLFISLCFLLSPHSVNTELYTLKQKTFLLVLYVYCNVSIPIQSTYGVSES